LLLAAAILSDRVPVLPRCFEIVLLDLLEICGSPDDEKNLAQAKFTIDTLGVIEEKTRGNLTPEEQRYLEGVLYDLKMSFVNSSS